MLPSQNMTPYCIDERYTCAKLDAFVTRTSCLPRNWAVSWLGGKKRAHLVTASFPPPRDQVTAETRLFQVERVQKPPSASVHFFFTKRGERRRWSWKREERRLSKWGWREQRPRFLISRAGGFVSVLRCGIGFLGAAVARGTNNGNIFPLGSRVCL